MRWRSGDREPEGGQATVEWLALVLGMALVLGAVAAGGREAARGESAHELGEALAKRVTCAARDACGATKAGEGGGGGANSGPGELRAGTPGELRAGAPGEPRGGARGELRSAPRRPRQYSALGDSLPVRGGKELLKRGWMLCLGYRRWRYEVEHPRTPRQAVPIRETAKMLNECVNPLSFLFG
jgi:hypothetical protein